MTSLKFKVNAFYFSPSSSSNRNKFSKTQLQNNNNGFQMRPLLRQFIEAPVAKFANEYKMHLRKVVVL